MWWIRVRRHHGQAGCQGIAHRRAILIESNAKLAASIRRQDGGDGRQDATSRPGWPALRWRGEDAATGLARLGAGN
jgi:hypothetical protein